MRDDILTKLLALRGANKRIAAACGISTAAVSQWTRIPAKHVSAVARVTGIPVKELRPDLSEESAQ